MDGKSGIRKSKKAKGKAEKKPKNGKYKTGKSKMPRLKPVADAIEPIKENFGRSEKGKKLIKQEMGRMKSLDIAAFPKRPAFDDESGECRLQFPKAEGVIWEDVVAKAPAYFLVMFRDRSRSIYANNVFQKFQTIKSQLERNPPVRTGWLDLIKGICELPS